MSFGTVLILYCDQPGCFQTYTHPIEKDITKLRIKAVEYNWSYAPGDGKEPPADFCSRHGYPK